MSRVALAVVPAVSFVVVAAGLRLGAGDSVRGAIVHATPRGAGATAWYWQVQTFGESWNARETISLGVRAVVLAGAERAETTVRTNDDGTAELELATAGRPEHLELRATDTNEVLARAAVRWKDVAWNNDVGDAWVKPTSRHGTLELDVAVPGGRLVAGFAGMLVVRVLGAPASEVELTAEGDGALDVATPSTKLCPSGRGALTVTPLLHVSALTLHAKTKDGRTGDWYGSVPVAHGGMQLGALDATGRITVTAPGTAHRAYFELDDDTGRVRAGIAPLAPDESEPRPHGSLSLQGVPEGDYWAVVSPDPAGAEKLEDAAIARRVHVGTSVLDACAMLDGAARSARGFPRWVALDGMAGRHAALSVRRRRGRAVALVGLVSGGAAELLLVLRAAQAAKRALDRLDRGAGTALRRRFGALEVGLALTLAVLGFALLAVFVVWL